MDQTGPSVHRLEHEKALERGHMPKIIIYTCFFQPQNTTRKNRPVKMGSKFRLVVYFRFGGKGGVGFQMEEVIKITGAGNSWMPFKN